MKKFSPKVSKHSSRLATMLMLPVVAVSSFLVDMGTAEAIPAFARQTAQACTSCHAQHFPTLNSFGRMFKAQGYTMGGTQESVVGNGLDLPGVLNAAVVGRLGLEKSKGEAKAIGFPASLSVYFGGRMGENSGFLMELPFEGASTMGSGGETREVEAEAGAAFAQMGNIKWNYVKDVDGFNVGVNSYSTSMAGPAYGYELLSTGAMGMNVATTGANAMGAIGLHMEHGSTVMSAIMNRMADMGQTMVNMSTMGSITSAGDPQAQVSMGMNGAATGLGVSVQNSDFFAYYSAYFTAQAMDFVSDPTLGNYLRVAWTPTMGGWDMGMGVQLYRGEQGVAGGSTRTEATTVDFQAQGELGGMPAGIYASYAVTPKSKMGDMNTYNSSMTDDNTAIALLVELEVIERLALQLGYVDAKNSFMSMGFNVVDEANNGNNIANMSMNANTFDVKAITLGANYLLAPNKRLGFKLVKFSGGDSSSMMGAANSLDDTVTEVDLMIGF